MSQSPYSPNLTTKESAVVGGLSGGLLGMFVGQMPAQLGESYHTSKRKKHLNLARQATGAPRQAAHKTAAAYKTSALKWGSHNFKGGLIGTAAGAGLSVGAILARRAKMAKQTEFATRDKHSSKVDTSSFYMSPKERVMVMHCERLLDFYLSSEDNQPHVIRLGASDYAVAGAGGAGLAGAGYYGYKGYKQLPDMMRERIPNRANLPGGNRFQQAVSLGGKEAGKDLSKFLKLVKFLPK